jgi:hypothetical protein
VVPIWFAGVTECADVEGVEAAEPERCSFDAFGKVVRCFGWPVRELRRMPSNWRSTPSHAS